MYFFIFSVLIVQAYGDGIYHVKNVEKDAAPQVVVRTPVQLHLAKESSPSSSKSPKEAVTLFVQDEPSAASHSASSKPSKKVTINIMGDSKKPSLPAHSKKEQEHPEESAAYPTSIIPIPSPGNTETDVSPIEQESNVDESAQQPEDQTEEGDEKEEETDCLSVLDTVAANPDLSVLTKAIEASLLDQYLSDTSLVATLFAPSNEAMDALTVLLGISEDDLLTNPALATVVGYHLIPGLAAYSEDFKNDQKLLTSIKQNVTVTLPPSGKVLLTGFESSNVATVIVPDIQACNAVVHIIDTVLLPDESVDEHEIA
eukprot:TRINITY_DN733_c0_g1_i1.p1 TRINITY_DN733_c0_g1~~TRINITY_DN733_c0_g1_i1.p1  ORF type:complete len:314 (+),score=52.20 TRINITY_DN733_c0_g1_i1:117-1058(+)